MNYRSRVDVRRISNFVYRRVQWILFGVTLLVRLIEVCRLYHSPYGLPLTGDMKFYGDWGMRIARGEWSAPHAFYGQPLYAYLLGATFATFGFHPLFVGIFQAMCDAITALLIFKIAELLFAKTTRFARAIGVIGALGWAMFVPAAAYCGLLISVSWLTAGWWFCIWWLLQRREQAAPAEWFFLVCFIGVLAMMSATILFALPLFLIDRLVRRAWLSATLVCLGVIIGTSPCWSYNCFVARDPVFLSAHGGVNFWIGNNPEANGYPKIPSGLPSEQSALLRQSIIVAESAAGRPLLRSEVSSFWSGKARQYITNHVWDWFRLLGVKTWNFWSYFSYDDLSSITALRDADVIPPGLAFGWIAAFALPGGLLAWRLPRARLFIIAILLQMVALWPVFINERYRLPAVPGLLLLAAFFLAEIVNGCLTSEKRLLIFAFSALVLSACFVCYPIGDSTLKSLDDYKTARRQIAAEDFAPAEFHLRRAFLKLAPSQMDAASASVLMASARDEQRAGNGSKALAEVGEAIRLRPEDESSRRLLREIRQELRGRAF